LKIPLELRDDIYDYVAYGEKTLGLHVNMEVVTEPKVHYYDEGLSRTCPQIRQEYTIRLQRRIKQLMVDHKASVARHRYLGHVFSSVLKSQTILIAEREVSSDVATRSVIPFEGGFDKGAQLSTLTFTLATSAVRGYDRRFGVPIRYEIDIPTWSHDDLMRYMSQLEHVAKPARGNGGFSFGTNMQQKIPMCTSRKTSIFRCEGVVGIPGFEDT
jgi:hypothetical protein